MYNNVCCPIPSDGKPREADHSFPLLALLDSRFRFRAQRERNDRSSFCAKKLVCGGDFVAAPPNSNAALQPILPSTKLSPALPSVATFAQSIPPSPSSPFPPRSIPLPVDFFLFPASSPLVASILPD